MINNLLEYIDRKFSSIKEKYHKLRATLSKDTAKKFKEVLKEEIVKTNDKLDGKIDQLCQGKILLQGQVSELKKQDRELQPLVKRLNNIAGNLF